MKPPRELEDRVWASAFAALFAAGLKWNHDNGRRIDDIDGFSVAEQADVALEKLREAFASDDAEFLEIAKRAKKARKR